MTAEPRSPTRDELVAGLKQCQSALAMVIDPDAIQATTVVVAWTAVIAAEAKARALITKAA